MILCSHAQCIRHSHRSWRASRWKLNSKSGVCSTIPLSSSGQATMKTKLLFAGTGITQSGSPRCHHFFYGDGCAAAICLLLHLYFYCRYGTVLNFELYRRDYIILYVDTVRAIVQREDPTRPFVVSSPSNGKESEEEGYIAKNPYNDLYGDSKLITLISFVTSF